MDDVYTNDDRNFRMRFSEETKTMRSNSQVQPMEINDLFMHLDLSNLIRNE